MTNKLSPIIIVTSPLFLHCVLTVLIHTFNHITHLRGRRAYRLCNNLTPDKYNIPYTNLKPKIYNFLHTKWQQRWNRNTNNKIFLFGGMAPSFPKIAKRASNYNAIAYWSQQTYALLYTQARTATAVLSMPNALYDLTRSP